MSIDEEMKKYVESGKFNCYQLELIRYGITEGLDISIYAKQEFDAIQMEEIIDGLLEGLDVSIYAKPEFNINQMRDIKFKLSTGKDVNEYKIQKFDSNQIEQIRLGLKEDLDISIYAKHEFSSIQMTEIREGLKAGIDVSIYAKPEFTATRMQIIRYVLIQGGDPVEYIKRFGSNATDILLFDYVTARQELFDMCIEKGIEPHIYLDQSFNEKAIREIIKGFKEGLSIEDISLYAKPEIYPNQMKEIREGLLRKKKDSSGVSPISSIMAGN